MKIPTDIILYAVIALLLLGIVTLKIISSTQREKMDPQDRVAITILTKMLTDAYCSPNSVASISRAHPAYPNTVEKCNAVYESICKKCYFQAKEKFKFSGEIPDEMKSQVSSAITTCVMNDLNKYK